jgi:integral membrane protein
LVVLFTSELSRSTTTRTVQEGTQNHMHAAVLRYRVMAYITGVLIIVVCFVGIPMQIAAHNAFIVNDIGTIHGFLYIVYIIFAYILAQKLKLPLKHTVILLLAGTVPVMTFFVERWMMRTYISPALAADDAAAAAAAQPVSR